jgi:hypothetical protein
VLGASPGIVLLTVVRLAMRGDVCCPGPSAPRSSRALARNVIAPWFPSPRPCPRGERGLRGRVWNARAPSRSAPASRCGAPALRQVGGGRSSPWSRRSLPLRNWPFFGHPEHDPRAGRRRHRPRDHRFRARPASGRVARRTVSCLPGRFPRLPRRSPTLRGGGFYPLEGWLPPKRRMVSLGDHRREQGDHRFSRGGTSEETGGTRCRERGS